MDPKDLCEHTRIRLIAAAIGHQQCTKTAANVIPIPGTQRFITIGTPAEVARLLDAAPIPPLTAPAPLTDERIQEIYRQEQAKAYLLEEPVTIINLARAIEREVLAKAAPAAPVQTAEEVLALHRQLAAEKLRADQGWARAEAKSTECVELRERMAAPVQAEQAQAVDGVFWHLFPGYLIDHHEGDTITEEGLQGWLSTMLRSPEYLAAVERIKASVPAKAEQAAAVPAGWTVEAKVEGEYHVSDAGGKRSIVEEFEPTLYRFFSALAKEAAIEAPRDPKQIAKWWSMRGAVVTAAINGSAVYLPPGDANELLNVFDAALPDDPSTTPSNDTSAQGDTGGDE